MGVWWWAYGVGVLAHPRLVARTLALTRDVAEALAAHSPDVAVLNAGYAMVQGMEGGIIMGTGDVLNVHEAAPGALLIASHMEAINHCALTRANLRKFAADKGFGHMLLTPGDGETVVL